jgi:predicted oxidoreductase
LADCPSSFEIEQKPFAFSHSITHHRLKVKVAEVILRDESELVIMLRWLAPSASRPSATECVLGAWGGVSSARWFRMEEVLHAVSSSLDRKAWCQITDATKYPTVLD